MLNQSETVEIWRHVIAFMNFPILMTIIVPSYILYKYDVLIAPKLIGRQSLANTLRKLVGLILIAIGLSLLVETNRLFHTKGKGTLAPYDPPQYLVIEGPYQYIRNPMLFGVYSILFGQVIVFKSKYLFVWMILFVFCTTIMHKYFEESILTRKFGQQYLDYCNNVPFIIPRLF